MKTSSGLRELRQLATLYGVQTAYYGVDHRRRSASADSLMAVVQGLGAQVDSLQDVPSALLLRQKSHWERPLQPVVVVWEGNSTVVLVRVPRQLSNTSWQCTLAMEGGAQKVWDVCPSDLPDSDIAEIDGNAYVVKQLMLPETLPLGYHRLTVEITEMGLHETLLVSAPLKAYSPFSEGMPPTWGVFLPLYALHSAENAFPYGDFSLLREFSDWTHKMGGGIVATLPILATFLEEPFEPSPYSPVSRLLWNEFYVDLSRASGLEQSPESQRLLESADFKAECARLSERPLVDYKKGMALKRRVLEQLSSSFFESPSSLRENLNGFLAKNPQVEDYARFRAVLEKQGTPWTSWPQRLRDGVVHEGDYEERYKEYHVYAQWQAFEQVKELANHGRQGGVSLYLDLPLGVHPHGYDVWRRPDLFARKFSVGAPPDAFFTGGQNWGFPPVLPQNSSKSGYDYYISYLRHHFQAAGLLRIDHVMGLHRLYWIPEGMDGSQGVYVRYPAEESYALLTLESHRSQSAIVAEDLGTVPPQVRPAMRRHGIYGMHVAYFGMTDNPAQAISPISSNVLASINTHDLPPFASFWQEQDINYRTELKHQNESGARREIAERRKLKKALIAFLRGKGLLAGDGDAQIEVLRALLRLLGRSKAPMVLGNLEDLWLEESPQNIPGTYEEYPNWCKRARYSFEEFSKMPQVMELLNDLDSQRRQAQNGR